MEYMLMPLKRYFDFAGRSRRKEYWMWVLFVIIVYVVAVFLDVQLGFANTTSSSEFGGGNASANFNVQGGLLSGIAGLVFLIPGLAVWIRRLHDIDKSGWWALIVLIPLIGGIWMLVLLCTEGTRGPNRFGPDPKGADVQQAFN